LYATAKLNKKAFKPYGGIRGYVVQATSVTEDIFYYVIVKQYY